MRLPLLAAALALTKSPAIAADCRVNISIGNHTAVPIRVVVESRTRANPRFSSTRTEFGTPLRSLARPGGNGRVWQVEPGQTAQGVVTFPLLGCAVERQIRYVYFCDGRERIFTLNGGARTRPTDLIFVPTC